jgi:hypothetical protein
MHLMLLTAASEWQRLVSFTPRGEITKYTLSRKLSNHKSWFQLLEKERNYLSLSEIESGFLSCSNHSLAIAPTAILKHTPSVGISEVLQMDKYHIEHSSLIDC